MQVEDGEEVTVTSVCLKNATISLRIQQPATHTLIGLVDVVVFSFPETTIRHLPPWKAQPPKSPCRQEEGSRVSSRFGDQHVCLLPTTDAQRGKPLNLPF